MFDGGSLASHSSQHAGRCSSVVSHHKRSCHGCLRQGSTSSAGGSGLVGVLDRVYQTMPSLPLN